MKMKNNLCTDCDGRGFYWIKGGIKSRETGTIIAETYREGPRCKVCGGSGERQPVLGFLGSIGFMLVLAIVFGIAIFA
jgi:hypothetical protein